MRRICYLVAVIALLLGILPTSALADHEDGVFELPAQDDWTTGQLTVYVAPPSHGQLYNSNGALGNANPDEVTPFKNSYLRAIEASIEE